MKISTEIGSIAGRIGEEKAVELVAKAGFDCWDFSLTAMCRYDWGQRICLPNEHPLAGNDYIAFARKLKKIGEDCGIYCNQSHAPFPVSCKEIYDSLKRAIECTAEAGGKICIIHPDNNKSAEENAEMYHELLPFAKDHGVKIATENMWNWDNEKDQCCFAACASPESFVRHVDIVADPYLIACLDIGHAEMRGVNTSAVEMIHALGHRIGALHLHDNDKWHDYHQNPFTGQIDFVPVVRALKEIGYQGEFTLETNHAHRFSEDDIFTGITEMAQAARKLADMFEE